MEESKIHFAIGYTSTGFQSLRLELLEYDTVENLKIEIHRAFDIPLHKQIIVGWKETPVDDQMILQFCCDLNRINYLTVKHLDQEIITEEHTDDASEVSLELTAAKSCLKKICGHIATSHVKFNLITLKYAVENFLFCKRDQRKVLLLYMHNSEETFSKIFLRKIKIPQISDMLCKSFCVVGWDLDNEQYHRALNKSLNEAKLEHLTALVDTKTCAAVILQNINGFIRVLSFLMEDNLNGEEDTFLTCLKKSHEFLTVDKRDVEADGPSENNDLNSEKFQKLMADMLGDRDYDCFASDQDSLLKEKIGYALFGQPLEEEGYSENQNEQIKKIFDAIMKHNNTFAEYKDQVEISFIYNVMEPLPKEKNSRAKKNKNYNPKTDITPVPIFVLRKCKNAENNHPCRIFFDDIGRKYETWNSYIEDNKLPECVMVLPKNGRYEVQGNNVLLEKYESPACNISKAILKGGDIASSIGGVGSGALLLTAGLVAIPAAPIVAVGAGVVGATAGIYGMVRSAFHLADRVKHDEDLGLKNSEARGIYFNLVAGTFGFVGAGANMAVAQLAARGVNIGQGVGAAVNVLGVTNIGVSGASIINSSYDVFDQWVNRNQTPSLLTIVQLSSSILFFGNAVYNYKSCQNIVEESQAQVLQEYQESLRSNRHRKTFDKLTKETISQNEGNHVRGRAEVIKSIRNIPNKDEVFAALTRNNKLMNKEGIKFSASNGEISFNGKSVNMNEFSALNKQQARAFLSNLPNENAISSSQTSNFIKDFSLNRLHVPNVEEFALYALRLISAFGTDIQGMIMHIVGDVIEAAKRFFNELLEDLFPNNGSQVHIIKIVMEYCGGKAANYAKNYYMWRQTGNPHYYDEEYVNVPVNKTDRYIWIFSKIVRLISNGGTISEYEMIDIIKYVGNWLFTTYYANGINEEENRKKSEESRKRKATECRICRGEYFTAN